MINLENAVIAGRWKAVKKGIEAGADVNQCDENGRSLLHLAAKHNHDDVALLLLDHNAWFVPDRTGLWADEVAEASGHSQLGGYLRDRRKPC